VNRTLGNLRIASPFTIPSGIVTTVPSVIARIARDVPQIGLLTTKTLSVEPRAGYREPILHEYYPGCFINAVGIANPGAWNFVQAMKPLLPLHDNKPLLVSIMGSDAREFLEAARILDPIADAFELNLSCPHVKGAGQTVGSDPEAVRSIIRAMKEQIAKPIIPKLSPNLADIRGMARICEEAGADGLCLINTVGPGIVTDAEGSPILSNVTGGLSGAGILPVGLKAVREASSAVNLPIIAAGGIACAGDVKAYGQAGASYFAVGSALAGMTTPAIIDFFSNLARALDQEPGDCAAVTVPAAKSRTAYFQTTVRENTPLGDDMFRLRLHSGPACDPGRFFFLRLAGVGEKPFSPAQDLEPVYLIRTVGPFTRALEKLRTGDTISMRGPYGQGFPKPPADRPLLLVGGGTGAAPIMMAASRWKKSVAKAFFGFASQPVGTFMEELRALAAVTQVCVDPPGEVGEVVRNLALDLSRDPEFYANCTVFLCGPRPMMVAAAKALAVKVPRDRIFMAREDIMKCGIGLCGSCGTETGLRSCIDGPVLQRE